MYRINFMGWLAILFVGIKLAGVISWSWPITLIPLWIGLTGCAIAALGRQLRE
jgi:hypothetical protein